MKIVWFNRGLLRIAAAALLLMGIGIYLASRYTDNLKLTAKNRGQNIAPGGNKAVLTLGNGSRIVLAGASNGYLANEESTVIDKTADGQINYRSARNPKQTNGAETFNTISTPRGGQYAIVLSDGTKVILNASSSLKYPVAFTGNQRKVELSGEAYFEVSHNAAKPFKVLSKNQTVEVLGTHFNINAYPDEAEIKTELLQGSVRVAQNGQQALLKPGEESVLLLNNTNIKVGRVDTAMAVAWKNGLFSFKRASLQTVMRQVARWYDVQVYYEGKIPTTAITGRVHRNANASQVMEILENLEIPFKIDGKKITILQK